MNTENKLSVSDILIFRGSNHILYIQKTLYAVKSLMTIMTLMNPNPVFSVHSSQIIILLTNH